MSPQTALTHTVCSVVSLSRLSIVTEEVEIDAPDPSGSVSE